LASPPRSKRAILRDVSVRFAPLPPVWRDGRVRSKALALKARAPYGAAGSNPRSLRHDVHVRQIRLAAAVRKTATFRGFGGSNPLTCTKLVLCSLHLGWRSVPISLSLIRQELARSNRAPRTATSSTDRTLLFRRGRGRGVRCEFESRRSRHISPVSARLIWRMLFHGIASRVRFPSPAPGSGLASLQTSR
jgi:hypothetical protein